jgi:D-xylose 1-dehydrogenase (NADP+, D-xylono-1,5-lactone-forming)
MADRIRWGILGNAMIARKCVIPAIAQSANGSLVALGTRNPGDAWELKDRYGIERVYDSYEGVLEDPELDAVYLPLPNHLHRLWTLKALAAGKHVLCEKPLACSAGEAREMVEAASANGRLLMEAFMYRFHPRSREIKAIAAAGGLGMVRSVHAAFTYPMAAEVLESADNARLKAEMGGGCLLDVGCYAVSTARWLLAQEPVSVLAQALYRYGVDVHLAGILRFPDGALAGIEAGFVSTLQQNYRIVGTEGAIELPHDAYIPWDKPARYTLRSKAQEAGKVRIVAGSDEYRLMVEHFAAAVQGKQALEYGPEDSVRNMQVLDALAVAAREERTVHLAAEFRPR